MSDKFWPTLFGGKFMALGLTAFFLPTRDWYEVVIRFIFIIFGATILLSINSTRLRILLGIGAIILVGWVLFAVPLIISMWPQDLARFYLWTLPFWMVWIAALLKIYRDGN